MWNLGAVIFIGDSIFGDIRLFEGSECFQMLHCQIGIQYYLDKIIECSRYLFSFVVEDWEVENESQNHNDRD